MSDNINDKAIKLLKELNFAIWGKVKHKPIRSDQVSKTLSIFFYDNPEEFYSDSEKDDILYLRNVPTTTTIDPSQNIEVIVTAEDVDNFKFYSINARTFRLYSDNNKEINLSSFVPMLEGREVIDMLLGEKHNGDKSEKEIYLTDGEPKTHDEVFAFAQRFYKQNIKE